MGGGTCMSIMLGENVTCAGWQVTLCDLIWHASSRSGAVLVAQTAIRFFAFFYLFRSWSLPITVASRWPHTAH